MSNGNGFVSAINTFRDGLSNGTPNGRSGSATFDDLINNITSLRRGILDLTNDTRRNLEHDCGWPNSRSLTPEAYRDLYDSDAIANRVVQLMPKQCWQVPPEVYEKEKGSAQTPFELSWKQLNQDVSGSSWYGDNQSSVLMSYLKRLDIVSGIGTFGVMLIGLDDGRRLDEPVEGVVDKVVGGIAFNKDNRLTDSWMTEAEEKLLLSFDGKPVPDPVNNKRQIKTPPPLTEDEKLVVHRWREQRKVTAKAVATVIENQRRTRVVNKIDPNDIDDGEGNPYSARAMFGTLEQDGVPPTSQQWFGTQFGDPEQLAKEPSKVKRRVTFLRVFDESSVQVTRWEASLVSPRFGQPVMYRIQFNDPRDQTTGSSTMPSSTAFVHWSRVIHVADNKNVNECIGTPRLRPVINNVLDVRKVRGAGAEGYYQSCFPTLSFETHPQLGGDVDVDVASLRSQIENLVNSLQRSVIGIGGAWKTLAPAVVDPKPHIEVGIEAICIQLACPVRIFKGSERGELASGQDDSQWNDEVAGRQDSHCTPNILVAFIDRCILMGVLDPPQKSLDEERDQLASATDPNPGASVDPMEDGAGDFGADAEDDTNPFAKKKPVANRRYKWVFNAATKRIERKVVRNAFCPTGEGGGVDPSCGGEGSRDSERWEHPASRSEARERVESAIQEVFGDVPSGWGDNAFYEFKLPGNRWVSVGVKEHYGAKQPYAARIDFGIQGHSNTYTGKELDRHSIGMLKKVRDVAAKVHRMGMKIQVTPADSKRKEAYGKALSKLGLKLDWESSQGTQTWNVLNAFPPKGNGVEPTDELEPVDDSDPMAEEDAADKPADPAFRTIETEAGYKIDWPDLDSLGDMDRAQIANSLTSALAAYVQSGAADLMPLYEYLTVVWQMDDDEAASIVNAMEKHQEEVQLEQQAEQEALMAEQGFMPEAPEGMVDPEQRDMDHEVAMEQAKHGGGKPGGPPGAGGGFPPKDPKKPKPGGPTIGGIQNAFCATGEGGGVDPSCGGEGGGGVDDGIQVTTDDGDKWQAKLPGDFTFTALHSEASGQWNVLFSHKDSKLSLKMTGRQGGKAVGVMRRMASTLDKFVEAKKPVSFTFSASNEEESRVSLYSKASKLIAQRHGYDVEEVKGHYDTDFTFKRKAAVGNSQRVSIMDQLDDCFYWDEVGELVSNAFCPTGEGGGQDNSCSPNGGTGGSSAASGSKADRIGKMVKREQSGNAPYIDLLIVKLKQDKVVDEKLEPHLVFADLKRKAEGLEPLNTKVSGKQLESAMKALKEYGDLSPDELAELLPHMKYPASTGKEGGVSSKELVDLRRIPASVLDKIKSDPDAPAKPAAKPKATKPKAKAAPRLKGSKDVDKITARIEKAKATLAKLKAELKVAKGASKPAKAAAKASVKESQSSGKIKSVVDTIRKMEADWLKAAKKGKSVPTGKQMEEQVLLAMGRASAHKVAAGMGHHQRYGSASVARHNVAIAVAERIHAYQRGKV